jgi:hypothetical protein
MYTLEEIAALRLKCEELKLEGREKLSRYTDEELQVICNGIGPDAFPYILRKSVTTIHPTLEPAAFIHDVEFWESDGTKESFTAANDRFKANGYICAKEEYAWYNPTCYLVMNNARRLGNWCQLFGWDGYKAQFWGKTCLR